MSELGKLVALRRAVSLLDNLIERYTLGELLGGRCKLGCARSEHVLWEVCRLLPNASTGKRTSCPTCMRSLHVQMHGGQERQGTQEGSDQYPASVCPLLPCRIVLSAEQQLQQLFGRAGAAAVRAQHPAAHHRWGAGSHDCAGLLRACPGVRGAMLLINNAR